MFGLVVVPLWPTNCFKICDIERKTKLRQEKLMGNRKRKKTLHCHQQTTLSLAEIIRARWRREPRCPGV